MTETTSRHSSCTESLWVCGERLTRYSPHRCSPALKVQTLGRLRSRPPAHLITGCPFEKFEGNQYQNMNTITPPSLCKVERFQYQPNGPLSTCPLPTTNSTGMTSSSDPWHSQFPKHHPISLRKGLGNPFPVFLCTSDLTRIAAYLHIHPTSFQSTS
jgi:hypothetical protein